MAQSQDFSYISSAASMKQKERVSIAKKTGEIRETSLRSRRHLTSL